MRRNAFQLSRRHKAVLYAVTAAVFLSGVAWEGLHRFWLVEGEFGPAPNPAEPWLLKAHGAAAMAMLLLLGTLIPIHIKRSWQARQNRATGVLLTGFFAVLTLSGYGLYYAAGEKLRAVTGAAHLWVGLVLPAILIGHIARGHWLRRHGRLRQQ